MALAERIRKGDTPFFAGVKRTVKRLQRVRLPVPVLLRPLLRLVYWSHRMAVECCLKGLRIGDGAVVGAGSVVCTDIPPFSIAPGNPACIVRRPSGQNSSGALIGAVATTSFQNTAPCP